MRETRAAGDEPGAGGCRYPSPPPAAADGAGSPPLSGHERRAQRYLSIMLASAGPERTLYAPALRP